MVDFNYKDIQYNGILKNWTGYNIKIVNELGEVLFNNTGKGQNLNFNKIKKIKFTDKNGSEISDPYQNDEF